MTIALTPEMLEACYEFLKTTPPFNKMGLPEADDVVFKISMSSTEFGSYRWEDKQHTITLSNKAIGYTLTLIQIMTHEMIHLYLEENGLESRNGGYSTHNAAFRKLAAQVCKHHGFDPRAFY